MKTSPLLFLSFSLFTSSSALFPFLSVCYIGPLYVLMSRKNRWQDLGLCFVFFSISFRRPSLQVESATYHLLHYYGSRKRRETFALSTFTKSILPMAFYPFFSSNTYLFFLSFAGNAINPCRCCFSRSQTPVWTRIRILSRQLHPTPLISGSASMCLNMNSGTRYSYLDA